MVDSNIDFVDEIGFIIKRGDVEKVNAQFVHKGEELSNIVNYLYNLGKEENVFAKQLWLDKIPNDIYIDELEQKYNYKEFKTNTLKRAIDNYSPLFYLLKVSLMKETLKINILLQKHIKLMAVKLLKMNL